MTESESDDKHPDNEKLKHDGWNDIKDKSRWCTDCPCLILLILAWIAMTIVGFIACGVISDEHLKKGDPVKLTNAIDYQGRVCGNDPGVRNKPYGYYMPDITVVCVKKCPSENNYEKFVCRYNLQSSVDSSVYLGYGYVLTKSCMYEIKTKPYLNRCLPDVDVEEALAGAGVVAASNNYTLSSSDAYNSNDNQNNGWFNQFLGDVLELRGYIFGFGLGVSTGAAVLYLYILRIPGLLFTIIWSLILSILVCLIVGSWLLWSLATTYSNDGDHTNSEVVAMRVFAYFGMAVSILYICLILVMRKRVQLAIGIVKQAARALATMPVLIFLPIVQVLGICMFLGPWIIYVLYLASSGEQHVETGSYVTGGITYTYNYRTFTYTTNTKYAFLYMLFCWFWTSEFVLAVGQLVIALAFVAWYFTRQKNTIGNSTVIWAFRTATYHHLGTAAFGSLIIAIIKTIRAVLTYIQKKAKKTGNKVLLYVVSIIQCCMICLEKCMKFINKHAYIMTAIYGDSFCRAARRAFFCLLRNVLRVAAVNLVASFLLIIGKLFVPIFTTFLCYLAMAYATDNNNISGIIAPLVFTFLLAYWVSSMFTEVFGMGIETILMCFIADEEMFAVEDRFAEGELMTTLQKTAQAAAAAKASNKIQVKVLPITNAEEMAIAKNDAAAESASPGAKIIAQPAGELLL